MKPAKNKRKIFNRFSSIQMAMMFSFSLIIVMALFIFLMISLTYTRNTVFENSKQYTTQIINQVNSDIDSYIDSMESISSLIALGSDVPKYLFNEKQSDGEKEEQRERILSQFKTIRESRDDISNIAAIAQNGNKIMNTGNDEFSDYIDIQYLDWYRQAFANPGQVVISPPHVQNAIKSSYKWVITLSRAMENEKSGEKEGVFFVDLNYSAISDLCDQSKIGQRGYVFIIDDDGNIIYHPQQQLIYGGLKTEKIQQILECDANSFVTTEGNDSRLYTMSRSEKTGWTVVGTAYTSELLKNDKTTRMLYFFVAASILIAAVMTSGIISRGITRPLEGLRDSMSLVQAGDFAKANVDIVGDNEIASLSRSFNVMTEKIHTLMEQNIYEQKQKRKNEMRALQAQINPHFLYNTLDSIIWMSESGKNEEVVLMTSALSKLFRQSISNEKEQVPIYQEVEYVKNYLTIQKMRYKDKLDYHVDVSPDIMNVSIIKFALQPLVENAIYHGLKYKDTRGNLWVRGAKVDNKICVEIEDDGIGMEEEVLTHIFDEKKWDIKSNGVGVTNVQKRLKLYYGPEYGIEYYSSPGKGTKAVVTIPQDGGQDEEITE